MDPNATLQALTDALAEFQSTASSDALAETKEHAGNLHQWIVNGGFMPVIEREQFAAILEFIAE